MEREIVYLIFITLGVFAVPFLSPLLKLPVAVGELLFGIVLSYFFAAKGLDSSEFYLLNFLSFLGFSLLMFMAGLEIDWNRLEGLSAKEKVVILLFVITNFSASASAVLLLGLKSEFVLIVGAVGIGLLISVLRELGIGGHFGQIVLLAGSLGEIFTLLGLTLYDMYLSFGGIGKAFIVHLFWIVLLGFIFLVLLKFLKILIWYFPEHFAALIRGESKAAVDIRASFALMLLFMSLTSAVHVEPILGAFIAGTLLGFIFREKEEFESKLVAVGYGFLIPFFFVQVGFQLDIKIFSEIEVLKTATVLLLVLFPVKLVSSLWFKFVGFSMKQIVFSALLFSFPFTVFIAVGKILLEKGIWTSEIFSSVVLLTAASGILFPFLVKSLYPRMFKS